MAWAKTFTRLLRKFAPLVLLFFGGVIFVLGGLSFFWTMDYVLPAETPDMHIEHSLILGEYRFTKSGFHDGWGVIAENAYGFRFELCQLPGQLKHQFFTDCFFPLSERGALVRTIDFSSNPVVYGSGFLIKLLPLGTLFIGLSLVWFYFRRRIRKLVKSRSED